ncbi:MAG: hypothetical protein M2R45_03577 [Verrucomicrobia subdivision 3 bacterium]|nr:hypothetical protein [Limisphaerales bacterium]MCS1414790.1 hypothetical protein [Limisphaerales bacterium]
MKLLAAGQDRKAMLSLLPDSVDCAVLMCWIQTLGLMEEQVNEEAPKALNSRERLKLKTECRNRTGLRSGF